MLRLFEIEEYICTIKSAYHQNSEKKQTATTAKLVAAVLVSCQKNKINDCGFQMNRAEHVTKKTIIQAKLNATKTSLKIIKKRSDFVTEFYVTTQNYLTTKNETECQHMRIKWILKQISLIETELIERDMIKTGLDALHEMKQRRRSLDNEDDGDDDEGGEDNEIAYDRSIKKSKQTVSTSDSLRDCQIINFGSQSKRRKRGHNIMIGDEPRFKRFKQSGFILKLARSDDDKRAETEKIDGQSSLRTNKSNNDRLQKKIVNRETRFFAISQSLRRSARIAARRKDKTELTSPAVSAQKSLFSRTTRTRSTTALRIQSFSVIFKRSNCVKTAKGRCSL